MEFLCNVDGSGKAQTLTIGDSESFNIVTSPLIQQSMKVQYCNSLGQLCQPTDVGTYSVEISFDSNGAFSWLGEIQNLSYNVYLNITQLRITASLSYRNSDNFSMEYNGNAKLDFNFISQYLFFKDVYTGNYLNISYLNSNFQFETNPNCYITIYNDEFDAQIVNAACGSGLNISIINFKLLQDSFSNNFILVLPQGIFAESINDLPNLEEQDLLVLEQKFEITQKILTISGIYVYDKVYDGTNKVDYDFVNCKFVKDTILEDRGLVGIDFENLKLEFEDRLGKVGTNKLIKVNTDNVLIDRDPTSPRAKNYKLVVEDFYKTIYPYSTEEVYVAGIGNISVVNKRGLIDENDEQKSYRQYVNLIKIGAKLDVEVFYKNGNEYRDIYTRISDYLSNTVAFAVGYKLSFVTDGFREDINKNLFLNLPKVRRLSQALWIDETAAGKLEYLVADNLMLDLQLAPSNVKCVVILQAKQFFTWWQITLIVLLILLIIILIILIYIHERRKKKKKDILNEKI